MPRTRPKYVQIDITRHGKPFVYFRRGKGARVRLPDDLSSEEFKLAYDAALNGREQPHVRNMPVRAIELRKQRSELTVRKAWRAAKARAAKKGLPFDLTVDWLLSELEGQSFCCALTGIEFFSPHAIKAKVDPYIPSLDRIDPRRGYTKDNVRIVVFALNAMLLDWGPEIFESVANSFRYQKNKKGRSIPLPSESTPAPSRKPLFLVK